MKIKHWLVKVLLNMVNKLTVKEQSIHGINKQDIDLITKAFPVFMYKQDMTIEQIALGTAKSIGEQRVIQFILSRIEGRIGAGVTYD